MSHRTKRDTAHDIACESWHLGIEQDTSTEAVQMVLYGASDILTTRVPGERMSSTNMTIMCPSGSAGPTMTRTVYDGTDLFYGWIPSAAHYGQPLPRYNFEGSMKKKKKPVTTRGNLKDADIDRPWYLGQTSQTLRGR